MKRTQLILTHSTPCCSLRKSSCCRRNVSNAGWRVIVYEIQLFLIPYIAPYLASKCTRQESACFPLITMHAFQVHVGKVVSERISMLILPQCREILNWYPVGIRMTRLVNTYLNVIISLTYSNWILFLILMILISMLKLDVTFNSDVYMIQKSVFLMMGF
jgi:hypothetical protein